MVSSIGIDSPEDRRILDEAIQITRTFKGLTTLKWPGPPGSELARLDGAVSGNITITDTLVSGQRSARASILHLTELFELGFEPRAAIAVSLSRAALVGAGRIIYVLGPEDPDERQTNAQKVATSQISSHLSAVRAANTFVDLEWLRAPDDLLQSLDSIRAEMPPSRVGDGAMIKEAAAIMADLLVKQGSSQESTTQLSEHLEWVWHVWSGTAHGWAWPKYFPGMKNESHDVAPGHWVTDFRALASLVQIALRLLKAGLRA